MFPLRSRDFPLPCLLETGFDIPSVSTTKRTVDACEATDREQFYWDPDLKGFGLKVSPGGAKSYIIQYRMGGRGARGRRYTLGQHGSPWTPAAARKRASKLTSVQPMEQITNGRGVPLAASCRHDTSTV